MPKSILIIYLFNIIALKKYILKLKKKKKNKKKKKKKKKTYRKKNIYIFKY